VDTVMAHTANAVKIHGWQAGGCEMCGNAHPAEVATLKSLASADPMTLAPRLPAAQRLSARPAPLGWLPLLTSHLVVALVALVAIGGVTRVMEAGLACPDWPLCYGLLLPGRQMNLQVFLEWFHRLDAFLVGLALLVLAAVSVLRRQALPGWLPWSAAAAVLLVAVQAAFGALTVLLLLPSSMVTAHLATALLLVFLLSATHQRLEVAGGSPEVSAPLWWRALVALAAALVLVQCVLGGLMASQWAADLCLQAGEGCRWLLRHRLGAWPAAAAVLAVAITSLVARPWSTPLLRVLAVSGGLLVAAQIALGLATLRLQLLQPAVTVGHQLTAALLIAVLGGLFGRSLPASKPAAFRPLSSRRPEVSHG
jgi:cytochrome c oxidase assembly protein subunit 15